MATTSSASTSTLEKIHGAGWWHEVVVFYRDPAIRYALKFGISGMLAVFLALLLKLQEPTWALFTVYVLMIAQYVGAIGEKSFFRMIGTAVGGVLGYLITASFEQNPWIFLPLIGGVIAVAVAMFGQARYPYAFLLCALTIVVVASNGLNNPDYSWNYMLWRVEEVGLGIFVTVLVQCLVWPRFARVEFVENVRAGFRDLQGCFTASAGIFLGEQNTKATTHAEDFPARILGLRGLLDFGARESHYFRQRLPVFFEMTSCLGRIASAIVTLGARLDENYVFRQQMTGPISRLHTALGEALGGLGEDNPAPAQREAQRVAVEESFREVEETFAALRKDRKMLNLPPEDIMQLSLHCVALDDIRQQILRMSALLDELDGPTQELAHTPEPFISPVPPPFWIKAGLKSGLAVMAALLIDDWFQPPGATMFVLGAWVFTALNATSPGGCGDRRAFHFAAYNIVALIIISIILLFARPLLSSYAVMNVIIFTWLFVWGYLSYSIKGMTIPMQMAMLVSVGLLGLNGQEPISFQAIVGLFFGLALAQLLSALIQRTIWPSLPQWELRDRFVDFLRICRRMIDESPQNLPLWQRARLALIPGEAAQRIKVLGEGICPEGEQQRLTDYLHSLQRTASHLQSTVGQMKDLIPKDYPEQEGRESAKFELLLSHQLAAHEKAMASSTPLDIDTKPFEEALNEWQDWMMKIRRWMITNNHPVIESLRVTGLAARYEQAGHDILKATEQARALRLPLYMGDYVL